MITPYKNREIDYYRKVELYRCLTRKGHTFSVRQDNLVVGHTDHLMLKHCEFVVKKAGRKRCITSGERNVHAWMNGYVVRESIDPMDFDYELDYSPYTQGGFRASSVSHNVQNVKKADLVSIIDGKIKVNL